MRTVDLALFADVIAARTAALEARLERARDRIRQAAIEREVRRALPNGTVERLERVGALSAASVRAEREEVVDLVASIAALRELQVWTERRLADAYAEAELGPAAPHDPGLGGFGGIAVEPPGRAARPEAASSVAPVPRGTNAPCVLPSKRAARPDDEDYFAKPS